MKSTRIQYLLTHPKKSILKKMLRLRKKQKNYRDMKRSSLKLATIETKVIFADRLEPWYSRPERSKVIIQTKTFFFRSI